MKRGYCWTCHADHPGDDQTCEQAQIERTKLHAATAKAEIRPTVTFDEETE